MIFTELSEADLQSLDLSWNGLETKGAVAVINASSHNQGLTMLSLASTRMADHACSRIAAALTQNSTLEQLMLNGNGITETGMHTLVQALQVNRTLKHLGLMVCPCQKGDVAGALVLYLKQKLTRASSSITSSSISHRRMPCSTQYAT